MDFSIFDQPRPAVDAGEAAGLVTELYGISGTAAPLSGERDRSFKIEAAGGPYVLKVGNLADRPDALEAQAGAVEYALGNDPGLPLSTSVRTSDGKLTDTYKNHTVQLTRFLNGANPPSTNTLPGLRRSLGILAAKLGLALRGYDHPALHRPFPWDLIRLAELAPLLDYLGSDDRPLIEGLFGRFVDEVQPVLHALPRQAIHGDLNTDNIVVDGTDPEIVSGIFDFGDMTWAPRICDLAVTATYQAFDSNPTIAIAQVAAAFHMVDALDPQEMDLLPSLVAGRCIQSLLMTARHVITNPENATYASSDAPQMLDTLRIIGNSDWSKMGETIRAACGLRPQPKAHLSDSVANRNRVMGPALALSYKTPVRLDRGDGVWLYDIDGRRLLDAYNNVPHVGHAHPQVVSALMEQSRRLTTNTRYLVDSVTDYAERLAGLLPDPLSVVMFVNSGSEANDLAYQIARAVTGHQGLVTTENAYHGTTVATTAMSPEEFEGPEDWTARIKGKESLQPPHSDVGEDLLEASRHLRTSGHDPAMAVFDTVFSSEGVFALPSGFLRAAREWADQEGALLVADEVQAGFGRVGPAFWGFAMDDAMPDIVTMGKPMGNGYPVGAVVTTQAIADKFAETWHFFSTFAGSPVAAAVGMAVIDVIEDEDLAARGQAVGDYLRSGITSMRHPGVVDVRGPGLFLGVEMADSGLAERLKEDMRDRGVLIGVTGPDSNVLKIRPPMVFTEHHADILLEELSAALAATS